MNEELSIYLKSDNNFVIRRGDDAMTGFATFNDAVEEIRDILADKEDFIRDSAFDELQIDEARKVYMGTRSKDKIEERYINRLGGRGPVQITTKEVLIQE